MTRPGEGSARATVAGSASGVSTVWSRKKQADAPESSVKDRNAVAAAEGGARLEPRLDKANGPTPDAAGESGLHTGVTPKLENTGVDTKAVTVRSPVCWLRKWSRAVAKRSGRRMAIRYRVAQNDGVGQ
ncbi:hypothetical protein CLOM_g6442 [Closterium sp. NIES-68]|nr:hypothetical protein CLOM_g6442 [Closterium sp. NIES-68]